MKTLIRKAIAALALAVGFTTAVRAATPVAVWEDLRTLASNGYAWTMDASCTRSADGVITIGDAGGLTMTVPTTSAIYTGYKTTIVMDVEVPNFEAESPLVDIYANGSYVTLTAEGTTLRQRWNYGGSWGNGTLTPGRRTIAVTYKASSPPGTRSFVDGANVMAANDLFSSKGNLQTIKLGCYAKGAVTSVATGLKIYKVALFDTNISDEEVAAYQFPQKWGNVGSVGNGIVSNNGGNFGWNNWTLNFGDASGMLDKGIGTNGTVALTKLEFVGRPDATRRHTKLTLRQGDRTVEATPVWHAADSEGVSVYGTNGEPTTASGKTVFGWTEYAFGTPVTLSTRKPIALTFATSDGQGAGVCAVKPANGTMVYQGWTPALNAYGNYAEAGELLVATVSGNTSWSALFPDGADGRPVELTLDADVAIDFDTAVMIPELTIKGAHQVTLVYTMMPTIATSVFAEDGATCVTRIPEGSEAWTTTPALTVPAGATFVIEGGAEAAKVWTGAITVNGTLKTEGLLNFPNSGNAVAAGGTLEVVSGELTLNGGDRKMAGALAVDAGATLVSTRNDLLNYDGTPTLAIGGTLDFAATRWTLGKGNSFTTVTLADGAVVRGAGDAVGAFHLNANGTYGVTGDATVSAATPVSSSPTITVASGKTLDFTGRIYPYQAAARTITLGGEGTIRFSSGYVTNVIVNAGSGRFVFAGDELVLPAGSEGAVTVAAGSALKLTVTATQLATGYEATGVTLEGEGRNITFVTPSGEEIVGEGKVLTPHGLVWTGAAGDTLWATAGNWSENTVPTAEIPARFTGDAVVTVAEGDTAAGLVIDAELVLTNAEAFAFAPIVSGAGKLVKAGAGALTLGGANTLAGGIDIVEGTVRLDNDTALGTNVTHVLDGATLDMHGKKPLNEIFLAGDGVDGNGALVTDVNMASSINTKIRLTADASWGGSAYYHFGAASDVQLCGFTFTKRGANRFPVSNTTIDGPGKIVVAEGAFENNNGNNHLEDIDFEVLAGAVLDMSKGVSLAVSNFVCRGTITGSTATLKVGGTLTVEAGAAFRPANKIECSSVALGEGAVLGLNAVSVRGFAVSGAGTVDVALTAAEFESGTVTVFTPAEGATTKLGTVMYDGKAYKVKATGGTITRIFKTGTMFFIR